MINNYDLNEKAQNSFFVQISEKDQNYIESKYAGSIYHQELENNLMNFLEFYENELPMYCTLRKQRQMYMDIEESPLYFDQ